MIGTPEVCPHCGKSHKPMVQQFECKVQHKYEVGDKVRVRYYKLVNIAEGEITALLPYKLVAPAYDVRIKDAIIAVSERSLEKIEEIESPTTECL